MMGKGLRQKLAHWGLSFLAKRAERLLGRKLVLFPVWRANMIARRSERLLVWHEGCPQCQGE